MTSKERLATVLVLVVAAASCGIQDPTDPGQDGNMLGSIQATTATTGASIDPDGYRVRVDEMATQPIGVAGSVTFNGITQGGHSVTLTEISGNCVPSANPISVTVAPGATAVAAFDITCS